MFTTPMSPEPPRALFWKTTNKLPKIYTAFGFQQWRYQIMPVLRNWYTDNWTIVVFIDAYSGFSSRCCLFYNLFFSSCCNHSCIMTCPRPRRTNLIYSPRHNISWSITLFAGNHVVFTSLFYFYHDSTMLLSWYEHVCVFICRRLYLNISILQFIILFLSWLHHVSFIILLHKSNIVSICASIIWRVLFTS